MPSETLSFGPARSYNSLVEAVLAAIESVGIACLSEASNLSLDTRLDSLGLDEVDLLDLVEEVSDEVGERGLSSLDGSELLECETIRDLVMLLATAAGIEVPKVTK